MTGSNASGGLLAALACAALSVAGAHAAEAGINVWTSNGPPGGEVRALAIDPITPSTLYAVGGGRVFKSTDAGASWNAADAGLPLMVPGAAVRVSLLAIDPIEPRTLYAGLSARGIAGGSHSLGVFKSANGGETWDSTGLTAGGGPVLAFAIDPSTPSTLYAGAQGGVLEDDGEGDRVRLGIHRGDPRSQVSPRRLSAVASTESVR